MLRFEFERDATTDFFASAPTFDPASRSASSSARFKAKPVAICGPLTAFLHDAAGHFPFRKGV